MLITLETALLAKEKGFQMNSCTFYQYNPNPLAAKRFELVGEESEDEGFVSEDPKNRTAVCMQYILQKWLRETHNIVVESAYNDLSTPNDYIIFIYKNSEDLMFDDSHPMATASWKTYEECLEVALQEGLKLI